jgi:hypothetical protein
MAMSSVGVMCSAGSLPRPRMTRTRLAAGAGVPLSARPDGSAWPGREPRTQAASGRIPFDLRLTCRCHPGIWKLFGRYGWRLRKRLFSPWHSDADDGGGLVRTDVSTGSTEAGPWILGARTRAGKTQSDDPPEFVHAAPKRAVLGSFARRCMNNSRQSRARLYADVRLKEQARPMCANASPPLPPNHR